MSNCTEVYSSEGPIERVLLSFACTIKKPNNFFIRDCQTGLKTILINDREIKLGTISFLTA